MPCTLELKYVDQAVLFSPQRLYEIIQKIGFNIVLDLVPVLADFVKLL